MTDPAAHEAPPAAATIARSLALYLGALFAAVGIFVPYWPLWLASRGQDDAAIGLLLATGVWMRVLVAPLIARAADGDFEHRAILRLLSALVFVAFGLYAFASSFSALAVLAVLTGAFWAAILPLADSLTLLSAGAYGLDYGRIRRWGSIAFLAASLIGGLLLRDASPDRVLWILLVPLALAALASLRLPAAPRHAAEREAPPPLGDLLRRPWLLHLLAAAALLYASHGMLNGFSTIHWRGLGIGEGRIGVLWTVSVLAEVVLFSFGSQILRRLRPLQLATLAAAAAVVRWVGLAYATSFAAILALQGLHGLTFGAVHFAALHFLHRALPKSASATAQTLFSAASGGLGYGFGFWLAGVLYGRYAGEGFVPMAGLAGLSALLFVILDRLRRGDGDDDAS
ncbi:MAG: MFS transporter [Nannocystaceae bacterium]